MSELLGAALRGMFALVGQLLSFLDVYELWDRRQRRKRLVSIAQGERVEIPCVLSDPLLTGGREQEGLLSTGDSPVRWHAKGEAGSTVFAPGTLTMVAVDRKAFTFRSEDARTELRLHPDDSPHVLRALAAHA